MKIYSVDTFWKIGGITEYEIVKETPKTYVAREIGRFTTNKIIKKGEMRTRFEIFCLSLDEIKECKKSLFERYIASNNRRIALIEEENAELTERLKALAEGDVNA